MRLALLAAGFTAAIAPLAVAGTNDGALEIVPLTTNVYRHVSYNEFPGYGLVPSNGLVIVDGSRATLVDTAWSEDDTRALLEWLDARDLTLERAVVTHSHADRTAGLRLLNELGVETFASARTNEILRARGDAPAKHAFTGELAGIEIFHPGKGHTEDNVVVWLAKERVLFGGCFIKSASSRDLGNVADAHVEEWDASVGRVLARYRDAAVVVPGHGEPGGIALLEHTSALVERHLGARRGQEE